MFSIKVRPKRPQYITFCRLGFKINNAMALAFFSGFFQCLTVLFLCYQLMTVSPIWHCTSFLDLIISLLNCFCPSLQHIIVRKNWLQQPRVASIQHCIRSPQILPGAEILSSYCLKKSFCVYCSFYRTCFRVLLSEGTQGWETSGCGRAGPPLSAVVSQNKSVPISSTLPNHLVVFD